MSKVEIITRLNYLALTIFFGIIIIILLILLYSAIRSRYTNNEYSMPIKSANHKSNEPTVINSFVTKNLESNLNYHKSIIAEQDHVISNLSSIYNQEKEFLNNEISYLQQRLLKYQKYKHIENLDSLFEYVGQIGFSILIQPTPSLIGTESSLSVIITNLLTEKKIIKILKKGSDLPSVIEEGINELAKKVKLI